ncbi:hypothetical protein KIN20_021735 [Parelaphostrongylus tenuis]|uniref:Uncharacterized protein n=1 Tax=Parelaphostrongylus tenuis TaxID=148309 RepID=A0AAD5MUK7_PARTN|nr:hypothetical protein KIN20_021735 [Parelaphostrongylus tenuis]
MAVRLEILHEVEEPCQHSIQKSRKGTSSRSGFLQNVRMKPWTMMDKHVGAFPDLHHTWSNQPLWIADESDATFLTQRDNTFG